MTAGEPRHITHDGVSYEVAAAGGVVWRSTRRTDRGSDPADGPPTDAGLPHDTGDIEVLIVHRPRYDDWSLPKGKLDEGEAFADAALREICEETGVSGRLGVELPPVAYTDHRGRSKIVRWWAVEAVDLDGEVEDTDEVDELRWVALGDVDGLLTYSTDADTVAAFRATVVG